MAVNHPLTFRGLDEDATVRAILEGTATETGERFFTALVENLSKALKPVYSNLNNFMQDLKQADDITLVVIKLKTEV